MNPGNYSNQLPGSQVPITFRVRDQSTHTTFHIHPGTPVIISTGRTGFGHEPGHTCSCARNDTIVHSPTSPTSVTSSAAGRWLVNNGFPPLDMTSIPSSAVNSPVTVTSSPLPRPGGGTGGSDRGYSSSPKSPSCSP